MIGSALKKLANENNMLVSNGVAYGSLRGYAATLCEGGGWKRIDFSTRFPDPVQKTAFMDAVSSIGDKELLKRYRVIGLAMSDKVISVKFNDNPGTMKKLMAFLDWFIPLLGQYQAAVFDLTGSSDVSRYGAQVINGIGFLGAGTIILTGRREVKGLTTAAALWACACMGLAVGAGFYECVLLGLVLIFLSVRILPLLEAYLRKKSRNLNLYVEFSAVQDVRQIISCLKQLGVTVVDVEVELGAENSQQGPNAVFVLRLKRKQSHAEVLSAVFRLEHIRKIDEL